MKYLLLFLVASSANADQTLIMEPKMYEECMNKHGCRLESFFSAKTNCLASHYSRDDCERRLYDRYETCKRDCFYLFGGMPNTGR